MMADKFLALDFRNALSSLSEPQTSIRRLLYLTMSICIHPILQVPPQLYPWPPAIDYRYAIILVWGHQAAVHSSALAHILARLREIATMRAKVNLQALTPGRWPLCVVSMVLHQAGHHQVQSHSNNGQLEESAACMLFVAQQRQFPALDIRAVDTSLIFCYRSSLQTCACLRPQRQWRQSLVVNSLVVLRILRKR